MTFSIYTPPGERSGQIIGSVFSLATRTHESESVGSHVTGGPRLRYEKTEKCTKTRQSHQIDPFACPTRNYFWTP